MNQQKLFRYGFFILIGLIILILVFKGRSSGDKLYENELENKVEALENDVSILDDKNEALQEKIGTLGDSLGVLRQEAVENELQKSNTIRYYQKKIKEVRDFSVNAIDSSFNDRYGYLEESDSNVVINKVIALEVTRDLLRLDQSDSVNTILLARLEIETKKVEVQEIIINDQLQIIGNMDEQMIALKEIVNVKDQEIKHWEKQFKKQRRQKFLIGGIGIALIVLSVSK